jgi:hypothetical protein
MLRWLYPFLIRDASAGLRLAGLSPPYCFDFWLKKRIHIPEAISGWRQGLPH